MYTDCVRLCKVPAVQNFNVSDSITVIDCTFTVISNHDKSQ